MGAPFLLKGVSAVGTDTRADGTQKVRSNLQLLHSASGRRTNSGRTGMVKHWVEKACTTRKTTPGSPVCLQR
ncbi:MAG: hypothetical protein ACT6QS_14805 [Flavobacteriales bacterium]